jgi:type IV pilus assembly protein PilC
MPTYAFTAISDKGLEYTGQEEAMSEVALEMRFRSRGHWLAKVREARPGLASGAGFTRGIPAQVLTEFFFQLSLQLRAGIPLVTALSNDITENAHPTLRKVMLDLVERVQSGQTLSSALSMHPRSFPPLVVNLVRAGEASGKLSETCNQVRLYLEWCDHLRADVRQALIYPMFILGCALLFVVVVFTFLVPRFAKLLTELNIPLPGLTQAVLGVSQCFVQYWLQMLLALGAAAVAFQLVVRFSLALATAIDRFKLAVPLLGPMWKMVGLSRFSQNLAIMYQAGLPLLDCLDLTRKLTGNLVIEQAIGDLRQAVNEGRQMHTAMTAHPIFAGMLVQMVRVGENTGSLGTALENVAAYYNEVLPRQIKRLFTLIEPILILFLIGFVGIIALSIFMPIVSLLTVQ